MPPLLLFSVGFYFTVFTAAAVLATHKTCSPVIHCPPFNSYPTSFPFSSTPGCGHPSFQINCTSSNHSLITINSFTFKILSYSHPPSLNLTPYYSSPSSSCLSLPTKPINFSNTPFHLSSSPCPSLFTSSYCTTRSSSSFFCPLTAWQSQLLSNPSLLFTSCNSSSRSRSSSSSGYSLHCSAAHPNNISSFIRSGFTVEWDPSSDPYFNNCSSCQSVCGYNASSSSKPFICFNANHTQHHAHHYPTTPHLLLLILILLPACVVVLIILYVTRRRPHRWINPTMTANTAVYSYDQLQSSTDNFDPRRKLGDGGFGSVYLAHLDDGRIAAVKRLHRQHPAATTKAFCNEISILSTLRHPNLVRLHGYCCDPRGLLLVYDYVPNGTLADHLHGPRSLYRKPSLSWLIRVDVALQTASAIEYLHFVLKPPVVHRDITTCNIFVERDMRIKVGDFGLSRLMSPPDPSSVLAGGSLSNAEYVCCTGPQGTPGYLDPDYHRSFRLTEKSDVYSFGVVLLELVTGLKAVDLRRDKREVSLADMAVSKIQLGLLHQVVDPILMTQGEVMGTIEAVAELAFRCVAGEKDDRPDAREIVLELKRIRGLIQESTSAGKVS